MERDLTAGSEGLPDPYVVSYPLIVGIADPGGDRIEVVEFYECIGGAQWVRRHYAQSPIVASARSVGGTTRYVLRAGAAPLDLEGSRFPAGIAGASVDGDEIAVA